MPQDHIIAFYNLENLFDTVDDPKTLDDDFTPKGFKKWRNDRYKAKIKKLGKAISRIGDQENGKPPVLVGIAEVENKAVVKKLINSKYLKDHPYNYVHYDSPDERGIDTALIYDTRYFEVLEASNIPLMVTNQNGVRDYTRDILYVRGKLNGEEIQLFVNHWPSKRDGEDKTKQKRIAAAQTLIDKLNSITDSPEQLHTIVMGDFNDDPNGISIQTLMDAGWFINPFKQLLSPVSGSANYKGKWSLFDQIILSHNFLNHEPGTHSYKKAAIFAPKFLKEWKGRHKGSPYRTFVGRKYIGGYSDHFPVYVVLRFID